MSEPARSTDVASDDLIAKTPAAKWREAGEPDPFGDRYDRERASLCGGYMTDDELANAVYINPSIQNLTAAKDRIRWLSRALLARISRAPITEAVAALVQARGALRLDAMVDEDGKRYGTTEVALAAIDAVLAAHPLPQGEAAPADGPAPAVSEAEVEAAMLAARTTPISDRGPAWLVDATRMRAAIEAAQRARK